ncbi:MAG: hypothetical protein C4534_00285 [Gaiellales bacterium]|nr:MAG: hypothetical protein C4534_00285 [Gaiellales bacterium]
MDLSKLSMSDKLIGVGSIVAIVSVFLGWYGSPSVTVLGEKVGGISISLIDGRGGLAFLIILAAGVALAAVILRMLEVFDMSDQGLPEPTVLLVAAAIAGLVTLYAVLDAEGTSRKLGMWIGLIGVAVFVVGAVMKFQEERA